MTTALHWEDRSPRSLWKGSGRPGVSFSSVCPSPARGAVSQAGSALGLWHQHESCGWEGPGRCLPIFCSSVTHAGRVSPPVLQRAPRERRPQLGPRDWAPATPKGPGVRDAERTWGHSSQEESSPAPRLPQLRGVCSPAGRRRDPRRRKAVRTPVPGAEPPPPVGGASTRSQARPPSGVCVSSRGSAQQTLGTEA